MPSSPSPKPGSSAACSTRLDRGPCMNSTVDMMSDFSRSRDELKTPDISTLKEDKTTSDDVIDLYRQVSVPKFYFAI